MGRGVGLGTVLLAMFITLKLVGVIDWSWWWVLSPLWLQVPLGIVWFVLKSFENDAPYGGWKS